MALPDIDFKTVKPPASLSDFVESYWMLTNRSDQEKSVVVLPDGRFDIFFSYALNEPFHITLSGLASEPSHSALSAGSVIFAVSFKLLASEYLLHLNISSQLNEVNYLPADFWGITVDDLQDFDAFCNKVSNTMLTLAERKADDRKLKLFQLIYDSHGALPVAQMADEAGWSSRQINRYFTHWFGISLKAYCNILRYRASFKHIKEGNLLPEQNFTDQAHFIKSVKKYSGVTPKELTKNKDDRFIQFSTFPKK